MNNKAVRHDMKKVLRLCFLELTMWQKYFQSCITGKGNEVIKHIIEMEAIVCKKLYYQYV